MKIKVTGGWSLGLEDEERRYTDGETFDAPDALAQQWIAGGQAVAVKAVAAAPNKAVTAAQTPNKSFTGIPQVVSKPIKEKS